jgi:hypothetical protein
MRKLVCLFAVISIAAPAFAGDITFSVNAAGDGKATISYAATDPAEGPVGIGLKVTLSGACSASVSGGANVASSDPCFNVAIDYAHDMPDPNDYTISHPGQHPLADPCEAGVPDPCSTEFSICMGRLDPCSLPPQISADLVTLSLDCHGDACCLVTVSIEEDNLRGGIVGAAWGSVDASDSTVVVCPAEPCEPPPCQIACWECASQCYGDVEGCDGDVDTVDWSPFRDSFGMNYCDDWNGGAGPYNPCADLDHDGDVDTVDWSPFRDNFGTANPPGLPTDCPMPCEWPPACP